MQRMGEGLFIVGRLGFVPSQARTAPTKERGTEVGMEEDNRMTLHHFTSPYYLPSILTERRLMTTLSEIEFPRAGEPYVLWLTTDPWKGDRREKYPSSPHTDGMDKTGIRFTLRLPKAEVMRWKWFAKERGATDKAISALNRASKQTMGNWYVIEREVPSEEWSEVTDTETGHEIPQSVWPAIAELLPKWQAIASTIQCGKGSVTWLPGRMIPAYNELVSEVLEIIRH